MTFLVILSMMVAKSSLALQTGSISGRSRRPPISLYSQADKPREEETKKNNPGLLRLAELSLKDYDWRSSVFKSKEADRKVEESLARMMGDEPAYVRPMDASEEKIGPLGMLEKSTVDWLRQVFEEEAIRARQIIRMGGMMVRPYEAEAPDGELGPLGFMEKQFVDFLERVRQSERERSRSKTLRPKDLDESMRGPLGEAESKAVTAIREILEAERIRMTQSKLRDEVVRPIDVPGPIGEFEMMVLEVCEAERQRALDRKRSPEKYLVRPKDASMKGPLGELEEQAVAVVKKLTNEEKERLRNIRRYLDENRPMEQDKNSALGILETIAVGIFRAPILMFQIVMRVKELLQSEPLAPEDAELLERTSNKDKAGTKKDGKRKD